ncbi:MAG: hypothetical protein H7067_09375 [Burkholderiales bacterium]|nr:hypothetical protein [Opitutaceae bacterium]
MNPSPRLRNGALCTLASLGFAALSTAELRADLLKNGDMTAGQTQPTGWDKRWVGAGRLVSARDEAVFKSAPSSLRVYAQEGSAKGQYYQQIAVAPGERLAASGWIKCEGADTTAQIGLQYFNDTGAPIGFTQIRYVAGNADWSEGKIVATAPAGAVRAGFILLLDGDGQAWLDDAVISRSSDAAAATPPPAVNMSAQNASPAVATNLAGEGTLIAVIADFRSQNFSYGYEGWKKLADVTKRNANGLVLTGPAAGGGGIVYGSPAAIDGATHLRLRYLVNPGHNATNLYLKLLGAPEASLTVNLGSAVGSQIQSRLVRLPERRPARVTQVQFQGSFTPNENFNVTLVDAAFVRVD